MFADNLSFGDTIGIISPSHIAQVEDYNRIILFLQNKGFRVKTGKNLYKDTYGYLATELERAYDFNSMISDKEVKLVFFGGGYGSIDLLPLIDYDNIINNPKAILSYSDGTSILNAIYSKTGLITYYGQTPHDLTTEYSYNQFISNLINRDTEFVSNSRWHCLNSSKCEGILVGGYTWNFALLINSKYFKYDSKDKYILFLEDHEKFSCVAAVSMLLSHIEQSDFISNVSGLLFGHYSTTLSKQLLDRLKRFGDKYNIPVAYCDDFGHGDNHAILPIGCKAVLDTENNKLTFNY